MDMKGTWIFAALYAATSLYIGIIACCIRKERTLKGVAGILLISIPFFGYIANSMNLYKKAPDTQLKASGCLSVVMHMLSFLAFMLPTAPLIALDGSPYGFAANLLGYAATYGIISSLQILIGIKLFGRLPFPGRGLPAEDSYAPY
jgi:hypothetical protein